MLFLRVLGLCFKELHTVPFKLERLPGMRVTLEPLFRHGWVCIVV